MIKEKMIRESKQYTLNIVQSQIQSIRKKHLVKTGLRIYKDGFIGIAGVKGIVDEKKLEKTASEMIDLKIKYPYKVTSERKQKIMTNSDIVFNRDYYDEMGTLLQMLKKRYPKFSFSNKIKFSNYSTRLVNDIGLDLYYENDIIGLVLIFKEKTSADLFSGMFGYAGRSYDRNSFLEMADNVLSAYCNPVKLPNKKKIPVIFPEDSVAPISKLIMDLDGEDYSLGTSLISGKIGKKIFNERFSLYQSKDPYNKHSAFFDAEGTVNDNFIFPLIEKGVLKNVYTDKKTAAMYNLPLTGSAGGDFNDIPMNTPQPMDIVHENKTTYELLGGQKAIFVMLSSGGDTTPKGDYASPVQLAYLYDGKKLIGKLPPFQISGNLFEILGKDYVGLSSDTPHPLIQDRNLILNMNITK